MMGDKTEVRSELTERPTLYDRLHLKMISLMHDTLYGIFVDPYRLLKSAGLSAEKTVLEVGCGPGFFTIPAAKIVGDKGHLYTIDINPAAVERVKEKVELAGMTNVDVMLASAEKTGLPDESVDVAFLFGILHSLKDPNSVLREMHRVLRKQRVLSVEKSSWSEKGLLDQFTGGKLFKFIGKDSRIYGFLKVSLEEEGTDHPKLTIED
jgi:ubiquinone/menaquinone biosynthesis C-methylase UbiE